MVEQFPFCNCRWWLFLFVCVCELRTYREKRKERKRSLATGGLGQFIQPKWEDKRRKMDLAHLDEKIEERGGK